LACESKKAGGRRIRECNGTKVREHPVRHLFIVTAIFETATGVLLVLVPAVVFDFLFGWRETGQETP
jgi:hypothetical protein